MSTANIHIYLYRQSVLLFVYLIVRTKILGLGLNGFCVDRRNSACASCRTGPPSGHFNVRPFGLPVEWMEGKAQVPWDLIDMGSPGAVASV